MNRLTRLLVFFLALPPVVRADDQVISADTITRAVVDTGLTRSLKVDRRKGLQYQASRSITVEPSRSLVEVEVAVEPDANISVPIRFGLNRSEELADQSSRLQLDEIAKALAAAPATDTYLIEGHTCTLGETDHNNRLSIARANFIIEELRRRGVKATLDAIGCGPAEAAAKGVSADDGEAVLSAYRKVMLHKVAQ
jgi:outer membrane protein OmpA-like peptidoglycan-associated protein